MSNDFSNINLRDVLLDPPLVHVGGTCTWGLAEEVLYFIDHNISKGQCTIETGLGLSTLAFVLNGTNHTAITPNQDEIDRLTAYCKSNNINLENTRLVAQGSENFLPSIDLEIDFALIDGGHGFPMPFLDWFYFTRNLKVGGILIVDDTQLWTGKILREFLTISPNWERVEIFSRSAAFRLTTKYTYEEWTQQPFMIKKSIWPRRVYWAKRALSFIARGDYRKLLAAIKRPRISLRTPPIT